MRIETKDLILNKPKFAHWRQLYENIWSKPESAQYMLWDVTETEKAAQERMERTIAFQKENDAWVVYEKKSGQAIGFAGMMPLADGVWEDCGIAVGPAFTGKGYGKQLLNALTHYAAAIYGAQRFVVSCRSENAPSRGMILSCGFQYTHREDRVDSRNGQEYVLEFYQKELADTQ